MLKTDLFNTRKFLLCWLLLLLVPRLQAQDGPELPNDMLELRSLDELMASALQHSPLLKVQALNVDNAWRELQIIKKEWSKYLAGVATVQLGNIQALGNAEGGVSPNFITQNNLFYGAGLQFRLSANDLLTQKDRRAILSNELEQEKLLLQDREMQIRELVIRQYQEVKYQFSTIRVRAKELDLQELSLELAEQYFRTGALSLEEYTTVGSKRNSAEEALLQAQSEAQVAFRLLRELVGTDISRSQ